MYEFQCTKCGQIFYSSSSLELQHKKNCEKCGFLLRTIWDTADIRIEDCMGVH
jgi:putative FmdB family regulatory protein